MSRGLPALLAASLCVVAPCADAQDRDAAAVREEGGRLRAAALGQADAQPYIDALASSPRPTLDRWMELLPTVYGAAGKLLDEQQSARVDLSLLGWAAQAFPRAADREDFARSAAREEVAEAFTRGLVRALRGLQQPIPGDSALGRVVAELVLRDDPALLADTLQLVGTMSGPITAWMEPLVSGLEHEDAGVREAAWQALQARTQRSFPNQARRWRRWWAEESVRRLQAEEGAEGPRGGRHERRAALTALIELLRSSPKQALERLARPSDVLPGGEQLIEAVAAAYGSADDHAPFHQWAAHPEIPPAVAAGVARGLRRLGSEVDTDTRIAALDLLHELCVPGDESSADPLVRVEVYRALPVLLPQPSREWVLRLIRALDHPDEDVRDAAWLALQRLSGKRLAQSSVAWKRWWRVHSGASGAPDDEPDLGGGGVGGGAGARADAPAGIDHGDLGGQVNLPSSVARGPAAAPPPAPPAEEGGLPVGLILGLLLLGLFVAMAWVLRAPTTGSRGTGTFVLEPRQRVPAVVGAGAEAPVKLKRGFAARLLSDQGSQAQDEGAHLIERITRAVTTPLKRADLTASMARTQTAKLTRSEIAARTAREEAKRRVQQERVESSMVDELANEVGMVSFGKGSGEVRRPTGKLDWRKPADSDRLDMANVVEALEFGSDVSLATDDAVDAAFAEEEPEVYG